MPTQSNNQKKPKLRFPNYSGEWEEKKIGIAISEYKKKTLIDNEYPVFTSSRKGLILQSEYYKGGNRLSERDNGGFNIIPSNYITYRSRSDDGRFHFNQNKSGLTGIISIYYPVFESLDGSNIFLIELLNQKWRKFSKYSVGTSQKVLSITDLKNIKLLFPSPPEQQKIANFLESVDKWIENLRMQKISLKSYKDGVMQKLFTQEIRFKGSDGREFPEWEKKKIGEVAIFLKGKGISKDDIEDGGNNKCIRYGELYTEYTEIIDVVRSRTNISIEDSFLSKKNDILIPSSGETALDIASVSCVNSDNILLGGDLNVIRLKNNYSGAFFAYYLSNFKNKDIAKLSQGNSVVHLYGSHLKALKLDLPSFAEQQYIANFLIAIDKLIESKQQRIVHAEQWKKGLLQTLLI